MREVDYLCISWRIHSFWITVWRLCMAARVDITIPVQECLYSYLTWYIHFWLPTAFQLYMFTHSKYLDKTPALL